jgi:hypothetical protein
MSALATLSRPGPSTLFAAGLFKGHAPQQGGSVTMPGGVSAPGMEGNGSSSLLYPLQDRDGGDAMQIDS